MAKVINHFLPKPPNLGTKTVTENGTVTAASEGLDGFSQVTVNVASSGDGGWQPDPLWTDIRTLWDDDTLRKKVASGVTFYSDTALTTSVGTLASSHSVTSVEATYGTIVGDGTDGTAGTTYYVAIADVTGTYIYSAIHLISASDTSSVFYGTSESIRARYITSDGYDSTTELTSDYTHTWDLSQDMIDSNGAYTRWVKVYRTESCNIALSLNRKTLWSIWNLGTELRGEPSGGTTFYENSGLQCLELESNVIKLMYRVVENCYGLKKISLPSTITINGNYNYKQCYSLSEFTFPAGLTKIQTDEFYGCCSLSHITLHAGITSIATSAFDFCTGLTVVTLESGFDANLKISASTLYSRQVLLAMIAAYKDNSGGTARTLTIGATNLAKLTAEDIAVATAKNLNLA